MPTPGARDELSPVGKIPCALTSGKFAANSFASQQDFRAEFAGLLARSFGEFSTADADWKSKIIFNLGTAAGLSAESPAFDNDSLESFGGSIDGKIVLRGLRIPEPAQLLENLTNRRALHSHAIREDTNGEPGIIGIGDTDFASLLIAPELNSLKRHVTALEESRIA